ncbi:MAG: LysR family transcriptional regulator [Henriciella sp.]|nr:LysR substrate-binding domain-containing protein [Hyphomonadaceae bacterium]
MRPTLRQLQYIVAVSETGRFHEAAKRLHVSQPSLSAQVADVEEQLDVQLIERGRNGALMTPYGEEFVRRARLILRDVEDLKSAMKTRGALSGRIRLGVLPSVGPYLLPPVVKDLHRTYPELRLIVEEHWTDRLHAHLLDGTLDCVISTPEDHKDMASILLFEEHLWICAAPDDGLAGDGPIKIEDLSGREILSVGQSQRLSVAVNNLAKLAGADISTVFTGTSLDAIRHMAATGAGIAILPAIYALSEASRDADLVLRPIDHPTAQRRVSLIWRPTSPMAPSFEQMADILRDDAHAILKNDLD